MRKSTQLIYIVAICLSSSIVYSQKSNIERSGDILSILIPTTSFATTLVYHDDNYKGVYQFAKSLGLAMITTYSLKYIINKERPNGGNFAFPSGHTMSSFVGAVFLERRYGLKVGIPACVLASFVGWSRINAKKHDLWDVLGGGIIGTVGAYLFTTPYLNKNTDISISKTDNGFNLSITHRF